MIIGIIGAMESEMANLINGLANATKEIKSSQVFYKAMINKHEVIATTCGIGKVNSAINTTLLINNFKPNVIINSGIAGGSKEKRYSNCQ